MHFQFVRVDEDLGVNASVTVVVRCERQVVAGHEILNKNPRGVGFCERDVPSSNQCRCGYSFKLFPSFRRFNTSSCQSVYVEVHDRRGRVERHADHLAICVSVEVTNARDVVVDVKLNAVCFEKVLNRNSCAFCADHGCCACVKHLHDVRLFASAERSDTSGEGLFVRTFEHWRDGVFVLARVKVSSDLVDGVTQFAAHCVPPSNFSFSESSVGNQREGGSRNKRQVFHSHSPIKAVMALG